MFDSDCGLFVLICRVSSVKMQLPLVPFFHSVSCDVHLHLAEAKHATIYVQGWSESLDRYTVDAMQSAVTTDTQTLAHAPSTVKPAVSRVRHTWKLSKGLSVERKKALPIWTMVELPSMHSAKQCGAAQNTRS